MERWDQCNKSVVMLCGGSGGRRGGDGRVGVKVEGVGVGGNKT